jgi:predicted  nucleic acid-binding Zn-ribbon protein
MTMRKTTLSEHIHTLENEMETRKIFLQATIDEIEELHEEFSGAKKLSAKDQKRLLDLTSRANEHKKWIDAHTAEIRNYYRPAMVIAG